MNEGKVSGAAPPSRPRLGLAAGEATLRIAALLQRECSAPVSSTLAPGWRPSQRPPCRTAEPSALSSSAGAPQTRLTAAAERFSRRFFCRDAVPAEGYSGAISGASAAARLLQLFAATGCEGSRSHVDAISASGLALHGLGGGRQLGATARRRGCARHSSSRT